MTLTEFSYNVRKYYPFAILGGLIILIMFYSVQLIILFMQNKPKGPQISPVFNVLKRPSIPEASTSAGIKFSLNNIEGRPVTATDTAKVYYLIPPPRTPFGFREKAYLIAKAFGFDTDHANFLLQGKDAVFSDGKQKLTVDIQNFNFHYDYNFANNPQLFQNAITPSENQAMSKAQGFLQSIDIYPQELAQGKPNTIFFMYNPDAKVLRPINKGEDGNVVEVDFSRSDIDTFPTVSSTFFNSQNYVLMAFTNDGNMQILRAQMKHFPKSDQQFGIYPVRTGDEAYADLKNGEGIIASNPQSLQNVTIRTMFMGYYDPDTYEDYLQPVYVFLGDDNFVAYVPAVSKQYIEKPNATPQTTSQ